MQRSLILACVLSLGTPAFAGQWLDFKPNNTFPSSVWSGDNAPVPGVNVGADDIVLEWAPQNNDNNAQNYDLVNGAIVYAPPAPPVVVPGPNPLQAEIDVLNDSSVATAAKVEIMKYKSLLDGYANNIAACQAAWGLIKANDAAIDSGSATAIETDCTNNNMPLVAQ